MTATLKGRTLGACSNCEGEVTTSHDVDIRIVTEADGVYYRQYQHALQEDCREALRRFMRGF